MVVAAGLSKNLDVKISQREGRPVQDMDQSYQNVCVARGI
jgi:hypothetical protein